MLISEHDLTVKYYVQIEDSVIGVGGSIRHIGWTNLQRCSSEAEAKDVMAKTGNKRGRLRVARVTTATLAMRD